MVTGQVWVPLRLGQSSERRGKVWPTFQPRSCNIWVPIRAPVRSWRMALSAAGEAVRLG